MTGAWIVADDLSDVRALISSSSESSLQPLGLREVVRGQGSVSELPAVLRRCGLGDADPLVILTDTTPKRYEEEDVLDVVLGILGGGRTVDVKRLAPEGPHVSVLANEATVANAIEQTRHAGPRALVSVGSGTVVDIAKVVAKTLSLAHVVVQTAASVNGFADNQSVLLVSGVKRTTPSRWPDALIIDPSVVALAPAAMTRSGLGDELSTFTAAADWCLASAVGIDPSFSPTLVAMMRQDLDILLTRVEGLGNADPDAAARLADCLTRGGLAMGIAGRTSPSSGAEHAISHLLEMHADAVAAPSASHGSRVGVTSVLAALIWRRVRQRLDAGDAVVDAANLATAERVLDAFSHLDSSGAMAQECWSDYERKALWIQSHLADLRRVVAEWTAHDHVIDPLLRAPEVLADALYRAGAPVNFDQLDPAPEGHVVQWAIANCNLMRDRFSIVDLAALIGAWTLDDVAALRDELSELAR